MAELSFNVGLGTPYNVPLAAGGSASSASATSGSSSGASATHQSTAGDTVTISPVAALLQASANSALLAATLGGIAAVTYSVDPGSTSSSTTAPTASAPGATALAELQAKDPATAQVLGNEMTLLQGQSPSGT